MNIVIIGTGYVGLVTAACLADLGHCVISVDIDSQKIDQLNAGIIPIYEPGLEQLVEKHRHSKQLTFTTSYERAFSNAQVCFLALPTPSLPSGACDLSYLQSATHTLARYLHSYVVIVNKSTAPIGMTQTIAHWIDSALIERGASIPFDVISNPEFLKEGCAIADSTHPDRILIGSDSARATAIMRELYAPLNLSCEKFLVMDPASAELSKYASNAMLAMRISFMNEMAALCEKSGANIQEVKRAVGADTRIGPQFLNAGAGYGGSCFPKDIKALLHLSQQFDTSHRLLEATHLANEEQKQRLFHKLSTFFSLQEGLSGKRIALWGLSFKPNTDDIREAPSLVLINSLLEQGAIVIAYDPLSMPHVKRALPAHPHLLFAEGPYEAAKDADAVVLVTEWDEFKTVNLNTLHSLMRQPAFFDGRNQFNPAQMKKQGFYYSGIGIADSPSMSHLLPPLMIKK